MGPGIMALYAGRLAACTDDGNDDEDDADFEDESMATSNRAGALPDATTARPGDRTVSAAGGSSFGGMFSLPCKTINISMGHVIHSSMVNESVDFGINFMQIR
jgi:hypothetical protein